MPTLAERGIIPPGARVSPHFSFAELVTTNHRELIADQEAAPAQVRANLVRLAVDLLEPVREIVGPLRINSAYRCPALNAKVGGSRTSAHMDGLAADVVPLELDLVDAYTRIVQSSIPWDQAILEYGRWLHLSVPRHAQDARRQALMIWEPGKYERFAAADPRVLGLMA